MERRNTVQRDLVLRAVRELGCHATPEEIYDRIIPEYPSISRGTVYRNLNLLTDMGAIRRVSIPGGPDHYDHNCSNHYHVHCIGCGKVFDVDMEAISDMRLRIKDDHGFEFLSYDIVFSGICPDCGPGPKDAHGDLPVLS